MHRRLPDKELRMIRNLFLASLAAFCASCAVTPQETTIAPEIQVAQSDIGTGVSIALRVVDERADTSLGHRGAAYKGAEIKTEQDVRAVIEESIAEGLVRKGFEVIAWSPEAARALRVDIRLLEYSTSMGFWTAGIHTKAALKVSAAREGSEYENFYRAENEKRKVFVPFAGENEDLINAIAVDVLEQLFADRDLLEFLTH
jgi:uncharacterized lipoprotein YajG